MCCRMSSVASRALSCGGTWSQGSCLEVGSGGDQRKKMFCLKKCYVFLIFRRKEGNYGGNLWYEDVLHACFLRWFVIYMHRNVSVAVQLLRISYCVDPYWFLWHFEDNWIQLIYFHLGSTTKNTHKKALFQSLLVHQVHMFFFFSLSFFPFKSSRTTTRTPQNYQKIPKTS